MMQDGLFFTSDQLLRQPLFRFIALHLSLVQQEVSFGVISLRKSRRGLETKDCRLWKKIGLRCCRRWRATHVGSTQWHSQQMAAGWPPGQVTALYGSGISPQEGQLCRH